MNLLRRFVLLLSAIFILGCVGSVGFLIYKYFVYLPNTLTVPNQLEETVSFEIAAGESVKGVAERLEELAVVPNSWALVQYLRNEYLDTKVEAGHFRFRGGETIPEVAEILLQGETAQIALTVLEGWNSFEMDAKLVELGLIEENDFALFVREGGSTAGNEPGDFAADRPVASLEGYIFPATYNLDPDNFSVDDLVERMLLAMRRNIVEAGWDVEQSEYSLHEILTMASIIELEEKNFANRPLVADILWRRYDEGTGLYADATIFYAIGHKENLTAEDLALDNPYNTRKYRGLPPTPVCSPSLSSIRAALHPQANEYWHYLHASETGEIHFAETLEEHNENKARYIQ